MPVDLSQKVGPAPLGAWLGGLGVVLGYSVYKRRKAAAVTAATPVSQFTTDPTLGNPLAAGAVGGSSSATPTPPAITDNNSWYRAGVTLLVARGVDPAVASSALSDFLAGNQLTAGEQADVNIVITGLGPPPVQPPQPGVPPVTVVPPPTPTPHPVIGPPGAPPAPVAPPAPPPAPAVRHYTVKAGDTLWGIASAQYGTGTRWRDIANANSIVPTLKNGVWYALIHPGQVLVIP
jgi:nucleoid-associated protein YgaU